VAPKGVGAPWGARDSEPATGNREPRTGCLWLVATPIGNLADMTERAIAILTDADRILAEDTRRTRVLLARHGIRTAVESFDAWRERDAADRIAARIAEGARVALVADAGTPCLSDPGARLVRAVLAAGLRVSPIPGASAIAAAACAAGIGGAFRFAGFLPRKGGERTRELGRLRDAGEPAVLFESPRRLPATLRELAAALGGERTAVVCRELTKLHEEIASGTLEALARRFSGDVRGEVTIVLFAGTEPAPGAEGGSAAALPARKLAERLLAEGLAPSRIARILTELLGLPHREAYRVAHGRSPAAD
jgi:16S rRNA (cytidine1402-2'-O)-methyltransferase